MDLGPAIQRPAIPPAAAQATAAQATAGTHAAPRTPRTARPRMPGSWPLLAVLAVQAVLSLRLVGADTAFQDEALYLWAGHLEWAGLLHGSPVPPFPSYFSGAPVIYPPLAALADSVGGLAAARILSLVFMLGATALLWATTRLLSGRRAAFFAAALFAVLGPTLHLGSFATYDAMALFGVALASWLVVRAGDRPDATGWMLAAGVVLALANATSYPSALFDPVVLVLALLTALSRPGGKLAAARALTLLAVLAVLITPALLIGGSRYLHGIDITTLERAPGTDAPVTVLVHFWSWTGVIVVAAVAGAVIAWVSRAGRVQASRLSLLAAAALLVPAEQASLYTTASLNKHGATGAWFAAIAAGYAVDRLIAAAAAGSTRTVTGAACVVALSFPVTLGAAQSWTFATSWPSSSAFVAILRPLADKSGGRLLVEDPSLAEYYLPSGSQWQRWSSTRNIVLPSGAPTGGPSDAAGVVGDGNVGTYAMYIAQGYFSLVALNFTDTKPLDQSIAADLRRNPRYHIIDVIPYGPAPGTYVIWRYEPPP
ncbi:MAG TPA: glycosyltransferase family 39 protein [Streptosporangiaceae bacterium]